MARSTSSTRSGPARTGQGWPEPRAVSLQRARQLAVMGQMLASPRPRSITEVVQGLGHVQLDPTAVVARTEHLVLWSRLGRRFRVRELERLLYRDRELFEYWVHIVPTTDFALHRETMRRYPYGEWARHRYVREWLEANSSFRRYVLRELRDRGPLRSRDLEDRTVEPWRTGGWNDDRARHVGMMLEILWSQGKIAIVGRDGNQRVWDLAERALPVDTPRLPARDVARALVERDLRARGLDLVQNVGSTFDGRPPAWEEALSDLIREGVAVPVTVAGLRGQWLAHASFLDVRFRGRTTLLSPFDDLVSDRSRTERLFGFRFRLEIYVPKAKREYGYFVLPILHGERLIGRIDPAYDRNAGVLRINAVYAEPDAPVDAWPSVHASIDELATWLGASETTVPTLPPPWR